ncbi:MAG: DUF2306 domain-containing protein [Flavobacteriaceae bacterium]|nr:DUF2306 domain-containing protein [Flavobacteriaceae bacterium]MDH3795844.1 DUF2306 domain-containing protein [Flavobacteriaceae bacterium]
MDISRVQNILGYTFMSVFAVFIGLYPLRFIGLSYNDGLLGSKPAALLDSSLYLTGFYTHIFLGGLALLAGFTQFYPKLRKKRLNLHRNLGKIYLICVLLSGTAGLGIAYYATGGWIPAIGFAGLAVAWLYTTANAYVTIRNKLVIAHQKWMIRSYALCFAAVTLRIYLPLFIAGFGMEFIDSYKIIAWLCWVPNILVAEFLIVRRLPSRA